MSSQTINRPSPSTDEPSIETLDSQRTGRAVAGQREAMRSRSTGRPEPIYTQAAPLPQSAVRPRGHVIGNAIGEPPAPTFAARPRGHVIGNAIGEPPAPTFAARPRGHVIGNAIGEPPAPTFAAGPHGHIVGHPVDDAPPLPAKQQEAA